MKTEKRIHKGYEEFEKAKGKKIDLPQLFGKWHYIFSNSRGEISLIRLTNHLYKGHLWEIYCIKGDLFEDIERFPTKKQAVEKIKEILGVDELSELIEKKLELIKKVK